MSRNGFLWSMCIGAIVLQACSKSEAPQAAAGDDSLVPAASSPVPASSLPSASGRTGDSPSDSSGAAPAESSLALKRGTLTLSSNQATFQPCGAQAELWVVDQSDGALREMFSGVSMPLELYIEAHGERTASVPDTDSARDYGGAFILEEVLYAAPPAESSGCSQPAPTYIVAARGNEPFWSVEVTTEKMLWRQPDMPKEVLVDAPQSQDSEGTVGYVGEGGGHKIELFVASEVCRDSMADAFFAYSARAVLDGKEFKGCARIGE
jgi:uncharacterized membrane protein